MTESLLKLQQEFQTWRSSCKQPGRIPLNLKQKVLAELPYHADEAVAEATGLMITTLHSWRQKNNMMAPGGVIKTEDTQQFISLEPASHTTSSTQTVTSPVAQKLLPKMQIRLPSGMELSLDNYCFEQVVCLLNLLIEQGVG